MLKAFITDIDGTLTDDRRRISAEVIIEIRRVVDNGIPVVLSSGNTVCFLDGLSHMIGTDGKVIAENGGVYRNGFLSEMHVEGDKEICRRAYDKIVDELKPKKNELRLFSENYRFSDIAFSRDVSPETVEEIVREFPIEVIDTGFAIHLHTPGISKGSAFKKLAAEMNLQTSDFLASGDSGNDLTMLRLAGVSVSPSSASENVKKSVTHVMTKAFGEGTAEALRKYF